MYRLKLRVNQLTAGINLVRISALKKSPLFSTGNIEITILEFKVASYHYELHCFIFKSLDGCPWLLQSSALRDRCFTFRNIKP